MKQAGTGITEYAWVGDAVMTAYIRERLVNETDFKTGILQKKSKDYLSAGAQARFAGSIYPKLNEEEQAIFRRGRNAHVGHTPKHASGLEYREATALEALIGWLRLEEKLERLEWLLSRIYEMGARNGEAVCAKNDSV